MTTAAEIERWLLTYSATLPKPRELPGKFSTEQIAAACAGGSDILAIRLADLDIIQRKTEVARRLNAFYTRDGKLRVGDEIVHEDFALALCAIFLVAADRFHNAKYLNTALKMLDGILVAPIMSVDPFLSECALKLAMRVTIPNA